MAIFFHQDVRDLFQNRTIIVIGDSIQRSVYKDLVCLWTQKDSRYLMQRELRAKGELAFLGDKLLSGGKLEGKMVNGVGYREVREFKDNEVSFKYYFVTRAYSEHVTSILNELKTCGPDIIIMNSTFWDLHHYGDNDLQQYKENLDKLLKEINEIFPFSLLFIWNAALPLAERCKGGFLRKGFLTIPVDKIMKANNLARFATSNQQKIFLDLFTELRNRDNFTQAEDGIHWGMRAHRKISNLILTEVCTSWNKKLPDPPQLPNRPDSRNSSPIPWSSYYPDNGDSNDWNSPPSSSYNGGYDVDYNILPYWDSHFTSAMRDRYQIPSRLLSGGLSSPYGYGRNFNLGYNVPYVSQRVQEYQPIQTVIPHVFSSHYPPVQEMNFNFATPVGPYHPPKYLFKPAYSDPFPMKSYSPLTSNHFSSLVGRAPGFLPTPPGTPSYAVYGSSSYKDRFKKLSNPSVRGCKFKSSTSTSVNTAQTSQSQTPQNSASNKNSGSAFAMNGSELSDKNNNEEQGSSIDESFPRPNDKNVVVETGAPPTDETKSPLGSANPGGSSDLVSNVYAEFPDDKNDVEQKGESLKGSTEMSGTKRNIDDEVKIAAIVGYYTTSGAKRKFDDDEHATAEDVKTSDIKRKCNEDKMALAKDSNPGKIACNESLIADANRLQCGMKRKLKDMDEPADVKDVHENGFSQDDGDFHDSKRKCTLLEVNLSQNNNRVEHEETHIAKNLAVHDHVRCALTYDSFI